MPITTQNLVRHELIGLNVKIKESSNKSQEGIKGRVIDETYSLFVIESKNKELKIPKDIAVFVFTLPNGKKVEVDGKILMSRPEDRIKKKFAKW